VQHFDAANVRKHITQASNPDSIT